MTTTNEKAATTTATTTLTLVRHGRTAFNTLRILQGACDSPLTSDGRTGVLVTAQHLSTQHFDAIYSSPQPRALATASILARFHDVNVRTHRGLREVSFGVWERRPEGELDAVIAWDEYLDGMMSGTHPGLAGGESGRDLMDRVARTFDLIVYAHAGQHVLVVSHGVTLGAYLALAGAGRAVALPNASVSRVEVRDGVPQVLSVGLDIAGHGAASRAAQLQPAF